MWGFLVQCAAPYVTRLARRASGASPFVLQSASEVPPQESMRVCVSYLGPGCVVFFSYCWPAFVIAFSVNYFLNSTASGPQVGKSPEFRRVWHTVSLKGAVGKLSIEGTRKTGSTLGGGPPLAEGVAWVPGPAATWSHERSPSP